MNLREKLEQNKIVKKGHFKLTSGRHSNLYVNKDSIYCIPSLFDEVIDDMCTVASMDHIEFDVVTGPAIAGAVLAVPISMRFGKIFVYPEKVTKTVVSPRSRNAFEVPNGMAFRRGYNKVIKNKRVLIIEDIITTGASIQQTIDAIRQCGGIPVRAIAIWNRSRWKTNDCKLDSLINEDVRSWEKKDCPQCLERIPLTDPKSGKVIT